MKFHHLLFCFFILYFNLKNNLFAQEITAHPTVTTTTETIENETISIIPKPQTLQLLKGRFNLNNKTIALLDTSDVLVKNAAQIFIEQLRRADGLRLKIVHRTADETGKIPDNSILFEQNENLAKEGYELNISSNNITLSYSTPSGAFYATQTLLQIFPTSVFRKNLKKKLGWSLPCLRIKDAPRYAYRGLHLDVCRHFFDIVFVKKYLDAMALHKFNTFHWHLTDDQGWRIEIKQYPKLTTVGSQRSETLIGAYAQQPQRYDAMPYGGFYTQAQIRDIVAYAAVRGITVVPEIEMPGHASAAIAAYPELSCDTAKSYAVATKWGIFEDVFCPSDYTFAFLQDVLSEVMALFPSKYIHIGGDECPKTAWKKSAFCQQLIREKGLKDENELQSYFIQRIERFVNAQGRSIIGWDEILEGGLAPNATVMSWRGIKGGIAAARQGHDVVMTPGTHCYFDHYQADADQEPLAIGGFTPIEKVYAYQPTPDSLSETEAKHILGAQGNVWTEYMTQTDYVEYMVYPRAAALAEVLWTTQAGRNFEDFTNRLDVHFRRLDALDIHAARSLYHATAQVIRQDSSLFLQFKNNTNQSIFYRPFMKKGDNLTPLQPYTEAIRLEEGKNMFITENKAVEKRNWTIYANKATALPYATNIKTTSKDLLTNGFRGTFKSANQWLTVPRGADLEIVLDLKKLTSIQSVQLNCLQKRGWAAALPDFVTLSLSADGSTWLDVDRHDFRLTEPYEDDIRTAILKVSPFTSPKQYVRITAKSSGKEQIWIDEIQIF